MHQTVDTAGESDENAEIRDRLDLTADRVAAVVVLGELLPGIGLALLHAKTDAAAFLVDVEHHDLDFLADVHHLGGIHVLVGPVHLRDVHQAFDAFFDFDEAAVIGDVRDLAEEASVRRIAPRDVLPRIRAQLLQPQGHALAFAIELQNPHIDLFADFDDFGRMLDALPSHVGDVQQSIDAAQVHEGAVVGEVLDDALDRCALLQIVQQRGTLGAVFLLDDRAARHDHVVAFLIELDHLEFERLVLQVRGIAHRAHVDQGTRQERPHIVDLDGESALHPARDDADDHLLFFEGGLETRPRSGALRLLARQTGLSRTVLDAVQGDFDGLAHGDLDFTFFVLELVGGNYRLGFQSDIDDDVVLAYFDDQSIEDGARTYALARDALFKQFRKTFCHVFSINFTLARPLCPRGYQNNGHHSVKAATYFDKLLSDRRRRASSKTRSTTASTDIPVVSSRTASALATRGEAARVESRRSRSAISNERAARLAATPFSFNCLWRLKARSAALAVRKILTSAPVNTTVPICQPSATKPGGTAKRRCRSRSVAATLEALFPASSVRMAPVTSAPLSQTRSSPDGPDPNPMSAACASRASSG